MYEDIKKEYKDLIERLKQEEGYTEKAFWDNKQYSYGYGTKAPHSYATITRQEAELELIKHLIKDIDFFYKNFNAHHFGKVRTEALLDMIYNLGHSGIMTFHNMIYELKRPMIDWRAVAFEAYDSRWRKQVGKRAERIILELGTGKEHKNL